MQTSQKHTITDSSHRFYNQPVRVQGSFRWSEVQHQEHYPCSDGGSQGISAETCERYCAVAHSPSTASFSLNESAASRPNSLSFPSDEYNSHENTSGSPTSNAYVMHKLRELKTAMLGPDSEDSDIDSAMTPAETDQSISEGERWKFLVDMVSRKDLKEMLCRCAEAVSENDMFIIEWLMRELRKMVSVSGEPIQRLGAYMLEGLVARLASSGSSIYKALKCKEPTSAQLLTYMQLLYEICPYFKFGYMSANGAIAEAMKGETSIHIIDFQIAQGIQWITLIQALSARPGGPPRIRITGIDDAASAYTRGGGLNVVGRRLSRFAESFKVPFEFHAPEVSASEIQLEDLEIRPGEAIAVNFALMLHHMPDESVDTQNHRDRLLRLVKSLSPKVVTLVEQEANSNTAPFVARFGETLNYYLAIFESIDASLPREHKDRINVEQHCLAGEIVNIVACEGAERVERPELLGKWRSRFAMAGFKPYPLSSFVNSTIKTLLEKYSDKHCLSENDGTLFLGWMNQPVIVSCAWR